MKSLLALPDPRAAALALATVAAAACSKTPQGTLKLDVGGEADALTRDPRPTQLLVQTIGLDGKVTEIARARLPDASTMDLGDRDTTSVVRFRVTASDDAGRVLLEGTSVAAQLFALEDTTLPVFVQRVGELARMPASIDDAREAPLAGLAVGRYVVVAGGNDAARASRIDVYDLARLGSLSAQTFAALPRAPKSMALWGSRLVLVDDAGASAFEMSDSSSASLGVPQGGTYADVAGGAAFPLPDGGSLVVGATRTTGAPSAKVLRVSAAGALSFASLVTPRAGAAAAWVDGRGLVVAGGSPEGAGVEVLAADASIAVALPYPADATAGAALAPLDDAHLVIAGGRGHERDARVLDLGCTASCAPVSVPPPAGTAPGAAALPVDLVTATATAIGNGEALVAGDDAGGASHVVRVSATAAREVPLKTARRGARLVRLSPMDATVVVGGATLLESFVP